MKHERWIVLGRLLVVLLIAVLALWRLPPTDDLLLIGGLLLYTYLGMRCCAA
jgi:hypothetical protein